jgi:heat shock protein HslJ
MQLNVDLRRIRAAVRAGMVLASLVAAGCATTTTTEPTPLPSIVGLWLAHDIAGAPVPSDVQVTLSLYGDGRAVGRAGCNNYTTRYQRTDDTIAFGPVASTRMACAPELMTLEQSYLSTLEAANRVERRADGTLVLTTGEAKQLVFRRLESAGLQDARARGVDFRGVGQEPGWVLELKEGEQITAKLDYGATSLHLPTPPAETAADGAMIYDASTDTDHLLLTIRRKICVDTMNDESHQATVQLQVNEKTYQGCGDWLD